MNIRSLAAFSAALFFLTISEAQAAPRAADAGTTNYVDISEYLPTWQERDAWIDVQYELKLDFMDVCGDTFCEGEYGNLEALSYRCSARKDTGEIGECVFVIAASSEEIAPTDGTVQVSLHQWRCVSPLAPHTDASQLVAALKGRQPLHTKLPGTDRTLYDGLVDCL
jgi:hypothetical protein